MTPERWEQIGDVFTQALELGGVPRAEFLAEACVGDPELRREVESLLASADTPDGRVDQPIVSLRKPPEPSVVGQQIGPYRVIEEIGRGGLGAVYLAVREDDFEHQVAIKLIKRGMDTDEIVRRFRAERQILARLAHPRIARLFDGGSTDDGLPYFVMEYVEGKPLDHYCKDAELSVEARLHLFCEVCEAVQFAHQNLVVHRDLKPSNILVADDGPKLLDFGIAKVLKSDDSPASILTRMGSNPMTLDYASPEQARGGAVATTTDVYSLGVLLCELLTGERPYQLDGCSPLEAIRQICEDEPISLRQSRPDLSVDLDSIALKALNKKPEDRYRSVEQLSDDVRCYLAGRPVLAHEGSRAYRAGKFLKRHKLGVAAVVALLLAVLIVGVTITVFWQQAQEERDRAEAEHQRAERVIDLLVDVFEAPDPDRAKGEEPTARELLDAGREKVLDSLGEEPEVRATLLQTMGRVYRKLGFYGETRGLLEEALRIRRETLDGDDPLVAESLHDLGYVLRKEGDLAGARQLVVEAVAIQRRNAKGEPLELAYGLTILGNLHYAEGAYEQAEGALLEALEIGRGSPGTTGDELLVTLSNLAATRKMLGRPRETVGLYREVLEIRRRLHGSLHTAVAQSLNSLGTVLRDLGELAEAEQLLRQALEIRLQLHGEQHRDVARARRRLGTVLAARGAFADAAAEYQQALDIQLRTLSAGHPEIAVTWTKQAALQAELGRFRDCEALTRRALSVLRAGRPDWWRVAEAESVLGGCLASQEHLADEGRGEVSALLSDSHSRLVELRGREDPVTQAAEKRLASFRESEGL